MKLFDLDYLEERTGWEKRNYRPSGDGRDFGYQTLFLRSSRQNYVRMESGFWVPEHYHEKRREYFVVLRGEALFFVRPDVEHEREEIRVKAGDSFTIRKGELHSVHNPGDDWFYLFRMASGNVRGDSRYLE